MRGEAEGCTEVVGSPTACCLSCLTNHRQHHRHTPARRACFSPAGEPECPVSRRWWRSRRCRRRRNSFSFLRLGCAALAFSFGRGLSLPLRLPEEKFCGPIHRSLNEDFAKTRSPRSPASLSGGSLRQGHILELRNADVGPREGVRLQDRGFVRYLRFTADW